MIRLATPGDVPAIVEMGRWFHEDAGWGDISPFLEKDCAETVAGMIEGESGIVLVAEDEDGLIGMAGAMLFPLYFNKAHLSGQELFLYVRPGCRNGIGGKLLATLETEARAAGAESFIMIALDKVSPEATGRFYRHRGYRPAEHSYIRRL